MICLVAATGNDSIPVVYFPASHSKVIAVGSVGLYNIRSLFSNYGTGLDIVAPGEDIFSTELNNSYMSDKGTSYATPMVSATAALMLSIDSTLTPSQIREALLNTSQKLPSYSYDSNGWNNEVGYGLLNSYEAIKRAVLKIEGDELICSTASYQVKNLPSWATVSWDISNDFYKDFGLFQDGYPADNQCTITRSPSINLTDTLRAIIYDANGDSIYTVKKLIRTRTKANFQLAYEYYGLPVMMSSEVSEDIPAKVPVSAIVKMGSNRFNGMNITATGDYSNLYHGGDSVWFTAASGRTYLNCTSIATCDQFTLCFYTGSRPPVIINDSLIVNLVDPTINCSANLISITLNQVNERSELEDDNLSYALSDETKWDFYVYRYSDGRRMFGQKVSGRQYNLSTSGWDSGIYIVKIIVFNQIFTWKIVI